MKQIQKPPFQQKAIAIGFTLGVHVIAVVGLLYLGLSKPPEPPKKLKTYLVDPKESLDFLLRNINLSFGLPIFCPVNWCFGFCKQKQSLVILFDEDFV